jgi:DNA-binding transcriptional regulator LsrR (DeoR family)
MEQRNLKGKKKRMFRAAKLRFMDDLEYAEIADRLGLAETTVQNYFSNGDMEEFRRFYSDRELFSIQQSIERDLRDGELEAREALANAQEAASDSDEYRLLAREVMELRQRKVDLLQELGVIEKQADKVEGVSGGPAEVSVSFEEVEGDGDVEELDAE